MKLLKKTVAFFLLAAVWLFSVFPIAAGAALPTGDNARLRFSCALKPASDFFTCVSEPLVCGDDVLAAAGNRIVRVSSAGEIVQTGRLPASIGYNCRLCLMDGVLILPLGTSELVGLDAETFAVLWKNEPIETKSDSGKTLYHSFQSSLTADGGEVFAATVAFNALTESVAGILQCISPKTGRVRWQFENRNGGYNWCGAAADDASVVIGSNDGTVTAFDRQTGAVTGSFQTGAPICAGVVRADGAFYTTSSDGTLWRFVLENGVPTAVGHVRFAGYSTSTPAIAGTRAYIGGAVSGGADFSSDARGVAAVVDVSSMTLVAAIETPAEVKSTCLTDGERCWFTCNAKPGALYLLEEQTVHLLYAPTGEEREYCIASPVQGGDGTVYYLNDSGTLFAVAAGETLLSGDADGDGMLRSSDARAVLRHCARLTPLTGLFLSAADISGDGKVSSVDARLILRRAAHLDPAD